MYFERTTILFLDDVMVEEARGVTRTITEPERHPDNPLIVGDRPWENWFIYPYKGTVLYDSEEKLFKMWYNRYSQDDPHPYIILYAISEDGINWEKPELDAVSYRGSTANNIVIAGQYEASNVNVFRDARETDPSRRYKTMYWDFAVRKADPELAAQLERWELPDRERLGRLRREGLTTGLVGAFSAFSPDGIHWTPHSDEPNWQHYLDPDRMVGFGDTFWTPAWDEHCGCYVCYCRVPQKTEPYLRAIGVSFSDDYIHWTIPRVIFAPDVDEPPGTEFYCIATCKYEGIYIGTLHMYHESPQRGHCDAELIYSYDGLIWRRAEKGHSWLPLGPDGGWENARVNPAAPLVVGDEIRIYYAGSNMLHTWDDVYTRQGGMAGGVRQGCAIGLATLRLDGFVSLDAGPEGGFVTTKPFTLVDENLTLNVDASEGFATAEIQDLRGNPLPGYTLAQCRPIRGDFIRHVPTWSGGKRADELVRQSVRLQVYLENAKLYSVRYE